jgi:hypothetical protein
MASDATELTFPAAPIVAKFGIDWSNDAHCPWKFASEHIVTRTPRGICTDISRSLAPASAGTRWFCAMHIGWPWKFGCV